MTQPNLDRLAQGFQNAVDGLQTSSTELARLGNLPSIADRQAARNDHEQLVELIQNLTTRLTTVEQGLNARFTTVEQGLNARLDILDTRLNSLDARTAVNGHNLMARSLNSSVNSANTQLSPLKTPNDEDVVGFPSTLQALNNLNGAQADRLLQTFALPVHGNLDAKKRRFQSFIGVPWGV